MNEYSIDSAGLISPEPDWTSILSDELEIATAREHWRILTIALRDAGTGAASNGHTVFRLILAYLAFDRASREVAENGAVIKPKRGNARAIARISPYFTAMRAASQDAITLEAELGLTPRRRGSVAKVEKRSKVARAADTYLRPVR